MKIHKVLRQLMYTFSWKSVLVIISLILLIRVVFIPNLDHVRYNQHNMLHQEKFAKSDKAFYPGSTNELPREKGADANMNTHQTTHGNVNIYQTRNNHVKTACVQYQRELEEKYLEVWPHENYNTVIRKADILAPKTKQFFWCKVPKVASESWTKLYINLWFPGKADELMPKQQVFLTRSWAPSRSVAFMRKINRTKFSYITVRHPFERILSAYRDKFFANGGARYERVKEIRWYRRFGKKIISQYRKTPPAESKYQRAPTFFEFISFLVELPLTQFDEHWKPMFIQCLPCHFHYQVIARLDTIHQDSDTILQRIGVKRKLMSSHRTQGNTTDNTVSTYYASLNKELLHKLYNIYKYDFIIFNYTADNYLNYLQ